jgi:diguanylate cyclase (GGDEF)-like protein/PAS domain S-box-containing protein
MRKLSDMPIQNLGSTPESSIRVSTGARGLSEPSALNESRDTLQAVMDAVPAMINVKDTDYRYILMNVYQAKMYGVSTHEAVGKTAAELIGDKHGAYTQALDREVVESGQPRPFFEESFLDIQGSRYTLLTTKVPLRDEKNRVVGIVTVSLDITARKVADETVRQSEAKAQQTMTLLTNAIESMNDGFVLIDHNDRLLLCNQRYRDLYSEVNDILVAGTHLDDIITAYASRIGLYTDPEVQREFVESRRAAWKGGYPMIEPAGDGRWVETRDQVTEDGQWIGIRIDVTERKQAEDALEQSEQRYRSLFEAAPISLWEADWSDVRSLIDDLRIDNGEQLNAVFEQQPEILSTAAASIRLLDVNKATLSLYHCDNKQQFIDEFHQRLRTSPSKELADQIISFNKERLRVTSEGEDARLDGNRFHVRVTVEIPEEHRNDWSRVFGAIEDITEAKALSRQLQYQAAHDSLTGLVNRREFENRLAHTLEISDPGHAEHALCYLDLDQFKVINDTCGHVAGDELLRRLGQLLSRQVRKQDMLARLGGDEFGVLLEHCSMDEAQRVANALRGTIEDFRFIWDQQSFSIGVSIGVVPIQGPGQTVSDILSAADAACYAAKDRGRNRIHVYHEEDVELARRHGEMRWVARLQKALEEDRFELAKQPIVPTSSSAVEGPHYEFLVRMRDEKGETVPPGAFLAAAERYNLSVRLDQWVVREAFRLLAADVEHLRELFLGSINLSGLSLADEEFLQFVIAELEEREIPPEKICFEITETAAIANLMGATHFIETLRELGCRFSLDDFGSGLSSFAYLKNLPVDFLKIDGVFVRDIVDDPIDRELVRAISEIGHVMGKRTIAEFVESRTILTVLKDLGVDYAQGYAMGEPVLVEKG